MFQQTPIYFSRFIHFAFVHPLSYLARVTNVEIVLKQKINTDRKV